MDVFYDAIVLPVPLLLVLKCLLFLNEKIILVVTVEVFSNLWFRPPKMRVMTTLEWALLFISILQLAAGVSLVIVNSLLICVEDYFIYRYQESESLFGPTPTENKYTLVSCTLYVLAGAMILCSVFGISSIYLWRHRTTFIVAYFVSALVSLGCFGILAYILVLVVSHQWNRLFIYAQSFEDIVARDYMDSNPRNAVEKYFDVIQKSLRCCGTYAPSDWLKGKLGYIPTSCCKFEELSRCGYLGVRLGYANLSHLSLLEAWDTGCYPKIIEREKHSNEISYLFYGVITGSGVLLQISGLSVAVVYKLLNFNAVMTPSYTSRL